MNQNKTRSDYYHPQTKFAKVMFIHLSIILFTGGGVSASVHAGTTPRADPPGADPPTIVHAELYEHENVAFNYTVLL